MAGGKFMRSQAREARKAKFGSRPATGSLGDAGALPHEAITDPPSPGATDAMAAGGEPVVRGNSNRQPMSPKGHAQIARVGAELARAGGPDEIISSTSQRTLDTARDVQASSPSAPPITPDPGLESRALGRMEGEPKTPDVKRFLRESMTKFPNMKIPGQGAMSSRPGESWNEFRQRAGHGLLGVMQRLAQSPSERILVPTSTGVIRFAKAWIAAGHPDDFAVDNHVLLQEDSERPGSMDRLYPDAEGQWHLDPFEPSKGAFPGGSAYLLRHGATGSTTESAANEGQRARARIVEHVRAGRYQAALKEGKRARAAGHLSDPEIESAVDEALPGTSDAEGLSPADLLAAHSAAGPERAAQLLPHVQSRFSPQALAGLPPEAHQALRTHLGRVGALQR